MSLPSRTGQPRAATKGASEALVELVNACTWPSEAFWRSFELAVLEEQDFRRPLLELGCGDGAFTALLGLVVDEAVDLNPRAVERARAHSETYGAVHCMDIRQLPHEAQGRYATIFANSVLEHIPDVETVLRACHRLLKDSGVLVFTVPVADMNRHLLIRANAYAEFRRRQLQHHNLWSVDGWRTALHAAGFEEVEAVPYLSGFHCRYWDRIDVVGDLGIDRYRVGSAVRKIGSLVLPRRAKLSVKARIVARLQRRLAWVSDDTDDCCATLLMATKRETEV
jgi:SAM-dependent methyltransferase